MQNENFLIIANQYEDRIETDVSELDSVKCNAIIYHFNDEHFIPMQSIYFDTAIKQFLPVLVSRFEFAHWLSVYEKLELFFSHNSLFIEQKFRICLIDFSGRQSDDDISVQRMAICRKSNSVHWRIIG